MQFKEYLDASANKCRHIALFLNSAFQSKSVTVFTPYYIY